VGVEGGMVVVSADEPSLHSTQNEQDNRLYSKLGYIPFIEPSTIQEAKDMTRYAFDLSERIKRPVMLRITTRIAHGRSFVRFDKPLERKIKGEFKKDRVNHSKIAIPAVSTRLRKENLQIHDILASEGADNPWNLIEGSGSKFGIITNGVSYVHVSDALDDLNAKDQVAVLRLGMSWPFPADLVADFIRGREKILIAEEVEPFLEDETNRVAKIRGINTTVAGKGDELFPRMLEFDPGLVKSVISRYFGLSYQAKQPIQTDDFPLLPSRPPALCPGCPHRSTMYGVTRAVGHEEIPFPLEIGCYGLGFLPPLNVSDICLCMGSAIPNGIGISQVTGKKATCFLNDSSFFHSGMTGLADAVHHKHNILVVIMDNSTTAMTGHQENPGMDPALYGLDKKKVDIESVCRAMGVEDIHVVRALSQKQIKEASEKAMAYKGLSVIIANEPCPLFAKRVGLYKSKKPFEVNLEKCTNCRSCITEIACPAFYLDNDFPAITPELCASCGLCVQICPENAIKVTKSGG
jgi:indolepyruvate ferredoxin oxidoreductase alpha subunit